MDYIDHRFVSVKCPYGTVRQSIVLWTILVSAIGTQKNKNEKGWLWSWQILMGINEQS